MRRAVGVYLVCALSLAGVGRAAQWRHHFPWPDHRILLLGTFHFKDAGLDSYKPEFDVDILSEERQREVEDVLGCLAEYRPTKIALEVKAARQAELDTEYGAFLSGGLELTSDETHQLGFKLAQRLGHRRVYAIDAPARWYEPYVDPDEYAREQGQGALLDSPLVDKYEELYRQEDREKNERTLLSTLVHLNDPTRTRLGHGRYLIENFPAGTATEYPGVDSKTAWYNRNLRIFANLQRIVELPEERILVIIGAGHLPILNHAIDSSPEFWLIEPGDYLNYRCPPKETSRAPKPPMIGQISYSSFRYKTGELLTSQELWDRNYGARNDLDSSLLVTVTVLGEPETRAMPLTLHVVAQKGGEVVDDRRSRVGPFDKDGALAFPLMIHGPLCDTVIVRARLETHDRVIDEQTLELHHTCGE